MPELAEVFYNASRWTEQTGGRFSLAWIHPNARCCRDLDGGQLKTELCVLELLCGYTHGKRMLFAFSKGVFLELHLGMTGSLHSESSDCPQGKHDHFALRSERSTLLFRDPRQFGRVVLHKGEDEGQLPDWWTALPPEPQNRAFSRSRFESMLLRRKGSILKPLLLRQELFPGVGNWMADEILWRARLRPDRRLGTLSHAEREQLFKKTKWVCRRALEIIGRDYNDPPASWLFRHRWKEGGICPVSKKRLRRDTIGGRTTCWSEQLQV